MLRSMIARCLHRRNWKIRSQASREKKVQRLDGFGRLQGMRLRYSLLPAQFAHKIFRKEGYKGNGHDRFDVRPQTYFRLMY